MGISKREEGQVLVLLVLGIIGLLAFAALAIDGGMVLVERRAVQNSADASSLTGGGQVITKMQNSYVKYQDWSCSDAWVASAHNDAVFSGIARAQTNNYTIDADISDHNGITTSCEDGVDNGSYVDKYFDVETHITMDIQTAFAHFITGNPIRTINQAVARVRPQGPFGMGHAIVALNPADCLGNQNGAMVNGTSDITIDGGGIFSYGCWQANGTPLIVDVVDGDNTFLGEFEYNGTGTPNISPYPQQGSAGLPDFASIIPVPDCSQVPNSGSATSGGMINPGLYSQIRVNNNQILTMTPGLYCVQDNFRVSGGGKVVGDGVTIYMIGGDFDTAGGAIVQISAPPAVPDPSPAIPNVLIYMAHGNDGEIFLRGTSDSWYEGTVFAPDGDIEVGGTGSLLNDFNVQLIAWNVWVHGTVNINIYYEDGMTFQYPPSIELHR